MTSSDRRFLTLRQWGERHAFPTRSALKTLITSALRGDPQHAGLAACLRRVGRTWLVDEHALLAWIDSRTVAIARSA